MALIPCPHCAHENSHLAESCLECGHALVDDRMQPSEIVVISLVVSTLLFIIYFMTAPHGEGWVSHAAAADQAHQGAAK